MNTTHFTEVMKRYDGAGLVFAANRSYSVKKLWLK